MAEPAPRLDEESSLGQVLRERREARGLTREQAAQRSHVQLVFVRALEEDDYRLLPDEMYLTRFLYEYARFLGLDPALADARFRRHLRREGRTNPLYRAVPRLVVVPWRRVLWTLAMLLPIIPLIFILLSLAGKERQVPAPIRPADSERMLEWGRASEMGPLPGARSPTAPPSLEPTQVPGVGAGTRAAQKPHRHVLVARAREVTWLAVQVDAEAGREFLLREGETLRWEADERFVLTVGNAGGLEVTLDGQPVRLPGGRGEVVRGLRLP